VLTQIGTLDFAMGPFPSQALSKEFNIEPVFTGTQTVVGRRNHPLCGASSLADLVDAEWILTGAAEAFANALIREAGQLR